MKVRQYTKPTLYKIFTQQSERWNELAKRSPGLDLSGSVFNGLTLERLYSKRANFDNCQFYNCKLASCEFFSCSLKQASFIDCELEHVDFASSDLYKFGASHWKEASNISFYLTQLVSAVFVNVKFHESIFIKANCQEAVIKQTEFTECVLEKANFTDAVFLNSKFIECDDLNGALNIPATILLEQSIQTVVESVRESRTK